MVKYTLFICMSFLCVSLTAQITDIKLGSDVWPPFTNSPGEPAFANEIVKEALNRNKVALDQRIMNFEMVMKGVNSDALDGSGAMWKSPEREELLLFSDPYLYNQLVLVAKKEKGLEVESLNNVIGHKLSLVEGYAYGDDINKLTDVEITYGMSDQSNFLKLLKGETDYMLVDELLIRYLLQAQPEKFNENLVVSETPVIIRSLHLAIKKEKDGAEALLNDFNDSVKKMQTDGTYNRILKLNWIQADIDGDGTLEWVGNNNSRGFSQPANEYKINYGDSSQYPIASGNTYYINGKVYTNWEDVPDDFKRGPGAKEDVETFNFLRFNF